jgi:probable phosphoglycerate mutase
MLTLHLVRHGDTLQASEGVFCGDIDPPLIENGLAQAERVARAIKAFAPDALYCSPKLRARQTAAPIAKACGLQPVLEDGLREIGYGTWDGRREADIRATEPAAFDAWRADPAMVSPPGGESAFMIAARAMPVINKIRAAHPTGQVVVVSHKATIRVIACALLEVPLAKFRTHVACPTTSITSFDFSAEGAMLVRVADVHHLA